MSTPLPAPATAVPDLTVQDLTVQDPMVGRSLGKYQLLRLVGEGGMGKVYEALNTTIHKHVALKCIDAKLLQHEEVVARFQREALAVGAVDSPYIVQIFDAGEAEGIPFIVMELLRGRGLSSLIRERSQLAPVNAVAVTRQVLKGLAHAHEAGIVHRDLKPDNVFLAEREGEPVRVKLLDFGVSKMRYRGDKPLKTLTRQGMVVGTPHYMSPEQAQALPDIDCRTDIYSVGAMLYECLAGDPPHSGDSYEQIIVQICMHDARDVRMYNSNIPEALAMVVHKALAREPAERYANAKEMLTALEDAAPRDVAITTSAQPRITVGRDSPPLANTVKMATPDALPVATAAHSGVKTTTLLATDPQAPVSAPMPPLTRRSPLLWLVLGAAAVALVGMALYGMDSGDQNLAKERAESVAVPPTDGTATATAAATSPGPSDETTASVALSAAAPPATAAPRMTTRAAIVRPPPPAATQPTAPKPNAAATSSSQAADKPGGLEMLRR